MKNESHNPGCSTEALKKLFPMPMTSIEKLHWFDDDPDLPNVIFCRMRVAERIDEQYARRAWQIAVDRQPFADVKPTRMKGRWHWTLGPRVKAKNNSSLDAWNGTRFEWTEYPSKPPRWQFADHRVAEKTGSYLGVSVWSQQREVDCVAVAEDHSEIWFHVHHAIGDGAGAVMVVTEWMEIYGNLSNGQPPEMGLVRIDGELLKRRNRLDLLTWRYLKQVPKQPIALFGATKFIFRKTAELMHGHRSANQPGYPSIRGEWIPESELDRLDEQAKFLGVTLNSLLLAQLFRSLVQWRSEQGIPSGRDWIRIILPMSIRNISDRRLPMTNRATIVQIDRCVNDMKDGEGFCRHLDREIKIIRGWQLDKMFLLAVRGMSILEPWLRRAARNKQSRGMAVFTNLGEPLRRMERHRARGRSSGIAWKLEEIDCVGPVRCGTPVNFSVARYQGALRVSLHFDAQVLSFQQAEELLKTYVDGLKGGAGIGNASSTLLKP